MSDPTRQRLQEPETPGDTDAPDIVSRTGEEMPEAAHDDGRAIAPTDPSSMPRADDHREESREASTFTIGQ